MIFYNKLAYILKETKRNFILFSLNTVASITIIFLTSLFVSLMTFFFLTSSDIINRSLKENQLRVFIAEPYETILMLDNIQNSLRKIYDLDSIRFISKKHALEEYRIEFGDDMLENITYNPLPSSFVLYLGKSYQKDGRTKKLEKKLLKWNEFEDVSQASEYVQWVEKWQWPILYVFSSVSLFFGMFLILIVSNTIKINLYHRKTIIKNMLYCGTRYIQILFPYFFENVILCFIGSSLSLASIYSIVFLSNQFIFQIKISPIIYAIFFLLPFLIVLPTCHYTMSRIIKKVRQK